MRLPFLHKLDVTVQKELDKVFAVYDAQIAYLEERIMSLERRPISSDGGWTPSQLTQEYTLTSAVTLTTSDLNCVHYVNCTTAAAITLPTGYAGAWIEIRNRGATAITVKNTAGTTIAVVKQYQRVHIPVLQGSTGADGWPLSLPVIGASGETYAQTDIIMRDSTKGFQWFDGTNWWRGTINTAGALVTADLGTTESGSTAPVEP